MTYISPERIARAICRLAHVDFGVLISNTRRPEVTKARVVIAGLAREMSGCSFPEIAERAFGRKTHSGAQRWARVWNAMPERDKDGWRWRVRMAAESGNA